MSKNLKTVATQNYADAVATARQAAPAWKGQILLDTTKTIWLLDLEPPTGAAKHHCR